MSQHLPKNQPSWFECVVNVSEGRRPEVIRALTQPLTATADVRLLHIDSGWATHRTVISFIAAPHSLVNATFELIRRAAEQIDMRTHHGVHPRVGATDVCPFVPLWGATLDQAAELARQLGQRVGAELNIPVWLYEACATAPHRQKLADLRRGEFEGLQQKLANPLWKPDYGPATPHTTAGATVIGARPILIAYNVHLKSRDLVAAKKIAAHLRKSLPAVRALGWEISEFDCVQVSMNLVDYNTTGIATAFTACQQAARALGIETDGSELVGLVPKQALLKAGCQLLASDADKLSERALLEATVQSLGLDRKTSFRLEERVLEWVAGWETPLKS